MSNPVIDAIKERRTVLRFEATPVEQEKVGTLLEAGRWAPSWLNKQPWSFILITDQNIKEELSHAVPTVFVKGLREAPLCIAVVVDSVEDPYHFVEAGAAATQNMTLAAHSLGLYSCWIGVFDVTNQKKSSENNVKKILGIPENQRVIALLPVGYTREEIPKKKRKEIKQLTYQNKFGNRI